MGSKKASGSILRRFCKGFLRISGGFGKVLGFEPILGWILDDLGGESGGALVNLKKAGAESLNRTPRAAPRSVSMRGGPPPPSVMEWNPRTL